MKAKFRFFFTILAFLLSSGTALSLNSFSTYKGPGLPKDLSGEVDKTAKVAIFEGQEVTIPKIVYPIRNLAVLGTNSDEKWIDVDLSEQKLRAWEGNTLFLETLVSTGLSYTPTPKGEFRIWSKVKATKMEGGSGKSYYYLPNVPYVMFFENAQVTGARGYGLHGTYWHNDFGRAHSHGCVNLPTPIAEKLYYWTNPPVPSGKSYFRVSAGELGTRIVIHE